MTLMYKLDPDILKMYHVPKVSFLGQGHDFQTLEHELDRQTDRRGQTQYHSRIREW